MKVRRRNTIFLAGCSAVFFVTWAGPGRAQLTPPAPATKTEATTATMRSSSGRFLVAGTNRVEVFDFVNWMEEIATELERKAGLNIPYGQGEIQAMITQSENSETGTVSFVKRHDGVGLVYTMRITNYDKADMEDILESVTMMYLRSLLEDRARKREGGSRIEVKAPEWLAQGLAQNLYPELKARNSDVTLAEWRKGKLKPISKYLDGEEEGVKRDDMRRSVRGLFVGMMFAQPGQEALFEKCFARIAEGGTVDAAWLAPNFPGCETLSDMDARWDEWVLKQKTIVYLPGVTRPEDVKWLKEQLLISPAVFGSAEDGEREKLLTLADLAENDVSKQVRDSMRNKARGMRIMSAGRSESFRDVVGSYCRFLDAVADGSKEETRKRLLNEAEEQLQKFEKNMSENKKDAIGD